MSRRRPDAGISVVETVIAASLAIVVAGAALAVMLGAMRSMRYVSVRTATTADARIAMEQLTREIRVAVRPTGASAAMISATTSSMSFYASLNRLSATPSNVDTPPTRIDYSYDGTCLRATQTPMVYASGAWTTVPAQAATKCLLRTTIAPVFAYYTTGAISVAGVDVAPLPGAGTGLLAADLSAVRSIDLTVTARSSPDPTLPATVLRSRSTLTNVLNLAGG